MKMFATRFALFVATMLAAGEALAHAGGAHVHGFFDGALHPVSGWDHALVALVVGLAAAQWRTAAWRMPALFIGGMALGMAAGATLTFGGWVESGILLSMLAVGVLLLVPLRGAGRVLTMAAVGVIGFAGAAHGVVHGVEAGIQPVHLGGVLAGTVLLHGLGIALGRVLGAQPLLLRTIGATTVVIAIAG